MYDNGRLSCDEVKRVIEIQSKCHQSVEVFDRHSTYQWKSGEFFTSSTSPCHSLRWKVTVARLYLSWSHQIFVKQIPALSIIKIFRLSPRRSCLSLLPSLLSSHLTEFFHFCPHLFHIPFILSRFHPQDFFVSSTTRDSERKWRDRSEPVRVILRCRSMNDIFDIKKKIMWGKKRKVDVTFSLSSIQIERKLWSIRQIFLAFFSAHHSLGRKYFDLFSLFPPLIQKFRPRDDSLHWLSTSRLLTLSPSCALSLVSGNVKARLGKR